MKDEFIRLENIGKRFGDKVVLNDLNLSIYSSEMVAILGKSGSGKTTLVNIIALFDSHFSGSYSFFGKKILPRKDYASLRSSKIGFVFQSYHLIDYLTVEQNILLPFDYAGGKKIDESYYEDLTHRLGIEKLIHERPNYLSGGEKQRICLARALVHKPQIIICDEPTGNLDKENTDAVIDMLTGLKSEDQTIIVVTHDLYVAGRCTRLLELKEGRIYEKKN